MTLPDDPDSDGPGTADELLPEVYDELRKLARARLARERQPHQTLQPTALVHEAYLRVSSPGGTQQWDRRGHFFAAAALAMRRILVERARHYQRIKHGAGGERVEFDAFRAASVPYALIVPRALDEDAAHRQRGSGKEVAAPIPFPILVIAGDAEVGLVDERRRLQRLVSIALAREARPRELAQFVIHFGQHVARRARAAVAGTVR